MQRPEGDWRGVPEDNGGHRVVSDTRSKLTQRQKYVRDIIHGQNIAPVLLESKMKPPDPAKGELRRILMKML